MRPLHVLASQASVPRLEVVAVLTLACLCLSEAPQPVAAQGPVGDQELASNTVSVQFAGDSFMFGVQYERRFGGAWVGRAGIAGGAVANPAAVLEDLFPEDTPDNPSPVLGVLGVPLGLSWTPGEGRGVRRWG
jgi:hypothetical protein